MDVNRAIMLLMLAGMGAYVAYRIEQKREDIRKTIQVIELGDVEFWRELTELRGLAPARA
jgi:hypothetical protein